MPGARLDLTLVQQSLLPIAISPNGFRFLLNEIDTALLFARLALMANCPAPRVRECTRHARHAYETFVRFAGQIQLDPGSAKLLGEYAEQARDALRSLNIHSCELPQFNLLPVDNIHDR